jgi:hypothetical protein
LREAARRFDARIKLFIALPFGKLDRMALKHGADKIRHMSDTTEQSGGVAIRLTSYGSPAAPSGLSNRIFKRT